MDAEPDFDHVLIWLRKDLKFQNDKLETKVRVLEPELKLRIERKRDALQIIIERTLMEKEK